jgi:tetratricopeptide (TPR) repeat protein
MVVGVHIFGRRVLTDGRNSRIIESVRRRSLSNALFYRGPLGQIGFAMKTKAMPLSVLFLSVALMINIVADLFAAPPPGEAASLARDLVKTLGDARKANEELRDTNEKLAQTCEALQRRNTELEHGLNALKQTYCDGINGREDKVASDLEHEVTCTTQEKTRQEVTQQQNEKEARIRELTKTAEVLGRQRIELKRERDALKRAHHQEIRRREGLEFSIETLRREYGELDKERARAVAALVEIQDRPPCPWAAILTNITDTAMEQLEAICGGMHVGTGSHTAPADSEMVDENEAGVPREKPLASDDPEFALSLSDVGLALQSAGQFKQAETLLVWALMVLRAKPAGKSLGVATALNNLGDLYLEMNAYQKAEGAYRRAITEYVAALGRNHAKVAALQNKLAATLRGQNRHGEAERAYHESIKTYESALGNRHAHLVAPIHNLAQLYLELSRFGEAEGWLRRAMSIIESEKAARPYAGRVEETITRLRNLRIATDRSRQGRRSTKPQR